MNKQLTCIECPMGCALSVDIENCRLIKVSGNKCPKGAAYALSEVENPVRILTATVFSRAGEIKMVPVRTDKPIPKSAILKVMEVIHTTTLSRQVNAGEVVIENVLGLGVNVVATRDGGRGSYKSA